MFEDIFARKRIVAEKLVEYGFERDEDNYRISKDILDDDFVLTVFAYEKGIIDTKLVERDTGEEYILYKTRAQGTFVGDVRNAVREVLCDIAGKCCEEAVYKEAQTLRLLGYARQRYGDSLEHLWEKTPECGVLRRRDTGKWYAVVMVIPANKLGLPSDETIEIFDLKAKKEDVGSLTGSGKFYPGWHMNKNSWYTVISGDGVSDETLYRLMRESYELAVK